MARARSVDLRIPVLKASATPRPQGWKRPSLLDAHEAFGVEMIDGRRDSTLDEMVERLSAER